MPVPRDHTPPIRGGEEKPTPPGYQPMVAYVDGKPYVSPPPGTALEARAAMVIQHYEGLPCPGCIDAVALIREMLSLIYVAGEAAVKGAGKELLERSPLDEQLRKAGL